MDPAQIILGNSRLNDSWQLRYATVTEVKSSTQAIGQYDGDQTTTVPLIVLNGPVFIGMRVSVIFIPPAGNYVIANGRVGFPSAAHADVGIGATESTSSSSYAAIVSGATGALNTTFTKYFVDTVVQATMHGSSYTGTVGAGGQFAVELDTDYLVAQVFFNQAGVHVPWSGTVDIPNVPPGTYLAAARWRRYVGAGSVVWDNNDLISFRLQESL